MAIIEDRLKELFVNLTDDIFIEYGVIRFIREYMELIPEKNNFVTISRLLKESEKSLLKLTEKIEEYETAIEAG